MSRSNISRVMPHQYKIYLRDDDPYYIALMSETNMAKWHVMVCNLEPPWEKGEFYFELIAPGNFPVHPPALTCLTVNGLYGLGGKICVSIGEFHKDAWRKSLGMPGFIRNGIVNGMICFQIMEESGGIRITKVPNSVKATRSRQSYGFNKQKNAALFRKFESFIAANPQLRAVKRLKLTRAGVPAEDADSLEKLGIKMERIDALIVSGVAPAEILKRVSEKKGDDEPTATNHVAPESKDTETGQPFSAMSADVAAVALAAGPAEEVLAGPAEEALAGPTEEALADLAAEIDDPTGVTTLPSDAAETASLSPDAAGNDTAEEAAVEAEPEIAVAETTVSMDSLIEELLDLDC